MKAGRTTLGDEGIPPLSPGFLTLPPWEMARRSRRVMRARRYLAAKLAAIRDPSLRDAVAGMFAAVRRQVGRGGARSSIHALACAPLAARTDGTAQKLSTDLPYDPTWAAPAAGPRSHHCYPGGWAIHTALNTRAACSLMEHARTLKGVAIDEDRLVAALLLHDWAKLKLLVWSEDHSLDADQGAGHHPLVLAECMARRFPPDLVRLIAGVHNGWWRAPDKVEESIATAAALAGLDPKREGYLPARTTANGEGTANGDRTASELRVGAGEGPSAAVDGWIAHQAEASWYTATVRALKLVDPHVAEWHAARGVEAAFARVRHALYTCFDELELVGILARGGTTALWGALDEWFTTGQTSPGAPRDRAQPVTDLK